MDEINHPHDVYFRESFTRREIAQDCLRWHLPAELLEWSERILTAEMPEAVFH